ncbi:MAG: hypothetical protein AAF458_21600 [Pseudomonadota bacterium]
MVRWARTASSCVALFCALAGHAQESKEQPKLEEGVEPVEFDRGFFRSDPTYEDKPYSVERQLQIYGGKFGVEFPRPLLEYGREIYREGPLQPDGDALGAFNPTITQLAIYGDAKVAVGYNDNGDAEIGQFAAQLNLDIDYKFTATERIHAFIQPLNQGGTFTRCEFAADNDDGCQLEFDANLNALFLEGDAGALYGGFTDQPAPFDLPFAIGFMPLLFQNGIWVEDAFVGGAFTIPALNSARFDISNMDITFFGAFDKVSSKGVLDRFGQVADHNVGLYGVKAFIEARKGYLELGYGFTDGRDGLNDQSYHNVTAAFSRRYSGLLSNSTRILWNFGQDRNNGARQNADGVLLLFENSLISNSPTTLVPYLNLFLGLDRPQSLARDGAAGGVLKNTGINFETDNLTGFPKLDDTANNTTGGALGLQYLFGLDQQVVVELATVQVLGKAEDRVAKGDQYAIGVRYQLPLDKAWIVRADAMAALRDNDENLAGIRFEIRRKF